MQPEKGKFWTARYFNIIDTFLGIFFRVSFFLSLVCLLPLQLFLAFDALILLLGLFLYCYYCS